MGAGAALDVRVPLRAALDPDPHPQPATNDRLAAVLCLLVEGPEPALVLTERAGHLRRHAGEVSFPGGLVEPGDVDLRATALREAREEMGLDPAVPEVVGALPPLHTFVSGILVTPFVGVVHRAPPLGPVDGEIARVLTTPIAALDRAEEERELNRDGGQVWKGWWYELDGATVWGATGFMVHALLDIVRKETPWLIPSR